MSELLKWYLKPTDIKEFINQNLMQKNRSEIDAKITELRRFKVSLLTCFGKSYQ